MAEDDGRESPRRGGCAESRRHCGQKVLTQAVTRRVPGWEGVARKAFASAQSRAQKLAYQQRRTVMRADLWLEEALSFAGESGAG